MTTGWRRWSWKLGLASWLVIGGAITAWENCALAQITPDTTLGSENSTVTPTGAVDSINGGATRGTNLFHSFQEFNIDEGRAAYFNNPAGIENILTRVTGANPSNILGTLGVSGGNANLFLINPNGIIFGPNSGLDVGGSFVGTTASGIGLANGDVFSANPGEPLPNQLLSVNPNALLFNQIQAQAIINRSIARTRRLEVPQGESLLLVGGNVNLEGGRLFAPGGRVELAGVAGAGTIGLNEDGSLIFPNGIARANVSLTNRALVNVADGGGGSIAVNAQDIDILGRSSLAAGRNRDLGSVGSQAGDITLIATEAITIKQFSTIKNEVDYFVAGNSGDINIKAESMLLTNSAVLTTSANGGGNAGDILVQVNGNVSFAENSYIDSDTNGGGDAGNISVNGADVSFASYSHISSYSMSGYNRRQQDSGNVSVQASGNVAFENGSYISSGVTGDGKTGDVSVQANGNVSFAKNSAIYTNVLSGREAGDVSVRANGDVSFTDRSRIYSYAFGGGGKAGDVSVQSNGDIFFANESNIRSDTTGSDGEAGDVSVRANDDVSFTNESNIHNYVFGGGKAGDVSVQSNGNVSFRDRSSIFTNTYRSGRAGNIYIQARSLSLTDGSEVLTKTYGSGDAGNIQVDAIDSVTISGISARGYASGLFTSTEDNASGQSGDIILQTGTLRVLDGAEVNVSSEGLGSAGNLNIKADIIRLENQGKLTAFTAAETGGNITLSDLNLLLMRDRSLISAAALNNANGGNITVNAKDGFVVAVPRENSDIVANASRGNGGRINITTSGIYGLQNRTQLLPDENISEINASSEFGIDGNIELSTPATDLNSGLVNLPTVPVDTEVAQACTPGRSQAQSEFVVTGRGGLPQNPGETLSTDAVMIGLITLTPEVAQSSTIAVSTTPPSPTPTPIVEAQGWTITANGDVVLTANAQDYCHTI